MRAYSRIRLLTSLVIASVTFPAFSARCFAAEKYTVIPQGTLVRGNLWVSDGPAGVFSSNSSAGNRFRFGGDVNLGDDYQYILGVALFDRIWSGESSASVGSISRQSTDLELGYFLVPDKLWLMYSLMIVDVSGDAIIGSVTRVGHQLSLGYRFYQNGSFNIGIEAAYAFNPADQVSTFDFTTSTSGTADFPPANIWSLNFRFGMDIGGR